MSTHSLKNMTLDMIGDKTGRFLKFMSFSFYLKFDGVMGEAGVGEVGGWRVLVR